MVCSYIDICLYVYIDRVPTEFKNKIPVELLKLQFEKKNSLEVNPKKFLELDV